MSAEASERLRRWRPWLLELSSEVVHLTDNKNRFLNFLFRVNTDGIEKTTSTKNYRHLWSMKLRRSIGRDKRILWQRPIGQRTDQQPYVLYRQRHTKAIVNRSAGCASKWPRMQKDRTQHRNLKKMCIFETEGALASVSVIDGSSQRYAATKSRLRTLYLCQYVLWAGTLHKGLV